MPRPTLMSRRHLLRAAAALAASGVAPGGFAAASQGAGALPARGAFVIRNAYVMTMDEAGDIANADVHVANGVIVAVGQNLKAPGVTAIDGQAIVDDHTLIAADLNAGLFQSARQQVETHESPFESYQHDAWPGSLGEEARAAR